MAHNIQALVSAFVTMADSLAADYDPVESAQELVEAATTVLPITAAAVLLVDHYDRLRVLASSNERTDLLTLFDTQSTDGPCLHAFRTGQAVSIENLTRSRDRWPLFSHRASAQGLRCAYALPMRLRQERIGALNLLTSTDRLDNDDIAIAQALADIATIGILHARRLTDSLTVSTRLQTALNTRTIIEQATGVLCEHHNLDTDTAFQTLREQARHTDQRLVDLARTVIARTDTETDTEKGSATTD